MNIPGQNNAAPLPAIFRAQAETHALANLRQAVWEATQFLDYDEIEDYVSDVLDEVESDAP